MQFLPEFSQNLFNTYSCSLLTCGNPQHVFLFTERLILSLVFVNKLLKASESGLFLIHTWHYVCNIWRQQCISLLKNRIRILRNRAAHWPLVAYREVDALLGRKDHFRGLYNNLRSQGSLIYTLHALLHTRTLNLCKWEVVSSGGLMCLSEALYWRSRCCPLKANKQRLTVSSLNLRWMWMSVTKWALSITHATVSSESPWPAVGCRHATA